MLGKGAPDDDRSQGISRNDTEPFHTEYSVVLS